MRDTLIFTLVSVRITLDDGRVYAGRSRGVGTIVKAKRATR